MDDNKFMLDSGVDTLGADCATPSLDAELRLLRLNIDMSAEIDDEVEEETTEEETMEEDANCSPVAAACGGTHAADRVTADGSKAPAKIPATWRDS